MQTRRQFFFAFNIVYRSQKQNLCVFGSWFRSCLLQGILWQHLWKDLIVTNLHVAPSEGASWHNVLAICVKASISLLLWMSSITSLVPFEYQSYLKNAIWFCKCLLLIMYMAIAQKSDNKNKLVLIATMSGQPQSSGLEQCVPKFNLRKDKVLQKKKTKI